MKTIINRSCPFCSKSSSIEVNTSDFHRWRNGELIQNSFPYLNADQREIIQTGICVPCWDTTFADE